MTLEAKDFTRFFRALWDRDPFPWQQRLATTVAEQGWPSLLDLPTGSGKTAAIDVALFHLALTGGKGAARRIAFVVDRRLVVDTAYQRAIEIKAKLENPTDEILQEVRSGLKALAGEEGEPLAVVRLHGGVPRESAFVRCASQPAIISTTIAQFGSRLLFRGYGVSDRMAPVHAGLLGQDCLALLDEAHLSEPFLETLRALPDIRVHQVQLTATPGADATSGADASSCFSLDDTDRANPDLNRRLTAAKPARLERYKATRGVTTKPFVDAALSLSTLGTGRAVRTMVVVNRVDRARAVFDQLRLGLPEGSDVRLAIGRRRALDAFTVENLEAGADRASPPAPIILVATQTVEAGADLDVEALVSELAPIAAMRQRFGRLNRLGLSPHAQAIILSPEKLEADDPVYGTALAPTLAFLEAQAQDGVVDFSITAQARWQPDPATRVEPPQPPILLPTHLDLWAATAPVPDVGPEVGPFLYGMCPTEPPVRVAWREEVALYETKPDQLAKILHRVRVFPEEVLEVPLGQLRAWLRRGAVPELSEFDAPGAEAPLRNISPDLRVFRWAGRDSPRTGRVHVARLAPNDLVILDPRRGGCDRWGWAPDSGVRVTDHAEKAARNRRYALIRLHPEFPASEQDQRMAQQAWLDAAGLSDRAVIESLDLSLPGGVRPHLVRDADEDGLPVALVYRQADAFDLEPSTDDDELSAESAWVRNRDVSLKQHSGEVAVLARAAALRQGLSADMVDVLFRAGWLHDTGKAAAAFQRLLAGGDPLAAYGPEPIGKSKRASRLSPAVRAATGFPTGARHEVASLHYARQHPVLAAAPPNHRDLILYLVGTHHGYGRPRFPGIAWPLPGDRVVLSPDDPFPVTVTDDLATLQAGWDALIARVRQDYSPWQLAHLEATLRLADHQASALKSDIPVPEIPSFAPNRLTDDPLAVPPTAITHALIGLEPDTLLGFLALVGTLAGLDLVRPSWNARAHWSGNPGYPILSLAEPASADDVAAALAESMAAAAPSFDFDGRKLIDWTPAEFRAWLQTSEHHLVPITAALAIEYPVRLSGKLMASPYALQLGPSHQNVLERFTRAITCEGLGDPPSRPRRPPWDAPQYITEALFNVWQRADDSAAALRWDPAEDQRYALRHGSPSKGGAAATNHGANRLAVLGLAHLPAAPLDATASACRQAGATRRRGKVEFRWPIWTTPWSLATLVSVLTSPGLMADGLEAHTVPSDVTVVMTSRRVSNQKLLNVTRATALPVKRE